MKKIIAFTLVAFSLLTTSFSAHAGPHKLGPFGIDYPTFEGEEKGH